MLRLIIVLAATYATRAQNDSASLQTVRFKQNTQGPIGIMTTSAGAPIDVVQARVTLNSRLIFNEYFMDSITHLVRERIPERVVHAKAGGGFGYFEVTHDITDICKAKLFSSVGKRTPVAVRLSPVVVERGGPDTNRDVRGFAIKFYTEDGNFDIVGFNTPMFVIKDPLLFTAFVRSQKRNPETNLMDSNTYWDFLTLQPEGLFMFMIVLGDRGIPSSYRHMPGFSIHTFELVNEHGERHFVRFHFIPEAGIKNLSSEEGRNIGAVDPDYLTRDLYNAIANGNFPAWQVSIQVLTLNDVHTAGFDVFDVTKVLPLDKYPLRPLGRFVLNRNALNYFADVEQLAYSPSNLVPGILGAPDKLFEARRLAYRDSQYYRLGANFNKIAVNCPIHKALAYNRDGVAPVKDNEEGIPNYYPNSFNGPVPYKDDDLPSLIDIHQDEPDNFDQARSMYENEMTAGERSRLVQNIVESLGNAAPYLQERAVKLYTLIHSNLGSRIADGLAVNRTTSG
ncbi:catalase-like [Galleria mellonella]|uniref:Catalase-like n=1 Tax=Galleria mellonella TaxID=7137 RepID=A0ABM3MGZ1_GALME|nr:catalase-like [Galleria mellonella]